MMRLSKFLASLVLGLIASCDASEQPKQSQPMLGDKRYPQKLAYCRIPTDLLHEHPKSKNDYFWLSQDAEYEASIVVVSRGQSLEQSRTHFVIQKLNLSASGNLYSLVVSDQTFGISPSGGAMLLSQGQEMFYLDLNHERGRIAKTEANLYSGILTCKAYVGQMPY